MDNRFLSALKNVTVLRVVLCTLVLGIAGALYVTYASAEEKPRPYKATTVDECIDEKACLKYVFLREVIKDYDNLISVGQGIIDFRLAKWAGPIDFTVIVVGRENDAKANKIAEELIDIIHEVKGYLGKRMSYTDDIQKANSAVMYAASLEEKFKTISADDFKLLTPDMVEIIKEAPFEYPKIMKIDTEGKYDEGLILVQDDMPENACLFGLVTSYLGVNEYRSEAFGLKGYNDCEMSILHKMIMSFLYDRQLKSGATSDEIAENFDKTYQIQIQKAQSNNASLSAYSKALSNALESQLNGNQ